MNKPEIKKPFFVFNPKSYIYGEKLLELIELSEELAIKNEITIFVTTPFADIQNASDNTQRVIVTAQHMDSLKPGRGMGYVLPESISSAGARAVFLNHAEHPMTVSDLTKTLKRAKELELITIVCADSILEAKAIAMLDPDVILCEPTELIGTGQTSSEDYIRETNESIKNVNPNICVMQAAGISSSDDVYRTISLGADGTGATSGIIESEEPKKTLEEMIVAATKAAREMN